MALYVTSLEAFPTPIDVCPLLPMIGEVMLGNVNVCSYKIALEKVFKMESIVLKNQKKGKGRITCPTLLVFISVDKVSQSPLLYML